MNTDKLSTRLETVASFVPRGARLADIGSDHAYLPCYLAKKNLIAAAIAGEVVEGPFESAFKQVQADGLADKIVVRMGDGLEVLQPGEVNCITIAGMGGSLIANILERGKDKLESVDRLILQPNISAISIRLWLIENGWELLEEEILEEDGKIYEILVAERGNPLRAYGNEKDRGLLFGPFLIHRQPEVFRKKWALERDNWKRIFAQLELAASTKDTQQKKQELLQKINWAEEFLAQ